LGYWVSNIKKTEEKKFENIFMFYEKIYLDIKDKKIKLENSLDC
jgi:hypothetical protein